MHDLNKASHIGQSDFHFSNALNNFFPHVFPVLDALATKPCCKADARWSFQFKCQTVDRGVLGSDREARR